MKKHLEVCDKQNQDTAYVITLERHCCNFQNVINSLPSVVDEKSAYSVAFGMPMDLAQPQRKFTKAQRYWCQFSILAVVHLRIFCLQATVVLCNL